MYRTAKHHLLVFTWVICLTASAYSQDTVLNKHGLWIISSAEVLKRTVETGRGNSMIDIKKHIPTVILEIKYASTDNFMHTALYPPIRTTYLREDAAVPLANIQKELAQINLGIKIWDAYRPYSVTEKMWEPVKDDCYAADPKFGSGHNRGIAVDLTLIELSTKKELDMGTGFDNFSDTAHHDFKDLPYHVILNRQMLRTIMERNGFKALETEWWHYYLPNAQKYELLDISFEALENIQ